MKSCLALLVLSISLWGCSSDGDPSLLPNPDPAMRKSSAELASDAGRRAYEINAPRGGEAAARAQYNLMSGNFYLVNLSDHDWTDVEVWINTRYVVMVPTLKKNVTECLDFDMFYDRDGHHFSTDGGKNPLQSFEIFRDGQMYSVPAIME